MFGFNPDMIFTIPALLIALTFHEYAHARVAVWLGDNTPLYQGRVTLNPIAHLDPWGLIMLWLFKFGWAKPVPINPNNFDNYRQGTMLVSFAGPAANIIMAILSVILLVFLDKVSLLSLTAFKLIAYNYQFNLGFALFNLLPVPPLDGSKILSSLLPYRLSYLFDKIEPYGFFILMFLLYFNIIGFIFTPIMSVFSLNTILHLFL
ncbi:putative membrane protein [Propionispora sp. 2/2-37]|uniref:site-2 protease family protein n=1 Tax=Propionispora sp. 2/2-37 TaxID=1677858 RepID=UPI0006BB5B25|nr:site-2 protease family protein [Propionispora sp. 2/2-37]CUH94066.1 putative membrane protein [Propionispora sp. 2/2-37]